MGLHGRQVNDVGTGEALRYLDSLGENIVQRQHLGLRLVVDPAVGRSVEVHRRQSDPVLCGLVLVVFLALVGVHDDSAVVGRHQVPVPHRLQRVGHALDLPRR